MKKLILALLLSSPVTVNASAISEICVRDWGEEACSLGTAFSLVESVDGEIVCARVHQDRMCKLGGGENFYHVFDHDGRLICTSNYSSPSSPFCGSDPENYKWVPLAYPDDN